MRLQNGFGQLVRAFELIFKQPGVKTEFHCSLLVRVGRQFQSIELAVTNSITISAWYENND